MTIELRCRKLKWATVPVQSWQMVITPLPTLSSTAQCPFSQGSYILTTMVSIYTLAAMVIQRQWSEWQWLEKLTTLNLWRLILFLVEVNEFGCLPRPPVRQTREMWRTMRDTKPLFPTSPMDPLMLDTGIKDHTSILFHNSPFSFTNFSFTRVFTQFQSNAVSRDKMVSQEMFQIMTRFRWIYFKSEELKTILIFSTLTL